MASTPPSCPLVRIRDLRKAHNWTQPELAERIAEYGVTVTPAAIANVELGRHRASGKLLTAWAKALGLGPMDVWQGPGRDESAAGETTSSDDSRDVA